MVQERAGSLKLLVIGASGFLGRNLLLRIPKNWDTAAMYNAAGDFPKFVNAYKLEQIDPVRCDLRSEKVVERALSKLGEFDCCVYLAADTRVNVLSQNISIDVTNNILPICNFLNHYRGGKLIFFSSGAVYLGLRGTINPVMGISPSLPYAISKLACEQYLRFWHAKNFGSYVIVRFFGAYGRFESERKITRRLLEAIRNSKDDRIDFVVHGDGRNLIDIMYTDDATTGILKLVKSEHENFTVDMCHGSALSINDYVRAVASIFGRKVNIRHEGAPSEYIEFYSNPTTMFDLTGFKAKTELRDGLRKYWQWLFQKSRWPSCQA